MEISADNIWIKESIRQEWEENRFLNFRPENDGLDIPLSKYDENIINVCVLFTYQLQIIEKHASAIFNEFNIESTGFDFWHDHVLCSDNDNLVEGGETALLTCLIEYASHEKKKRESLTDIVINEGKKRRPKHRRSLEQIFKDSDICLENFYSLLKKHKFINDNNVYSLEYDTKRFNGYIAGFLDGFKKEYILKGGKIEFYSAFAAEFNLVLTRITGTESLGYIKMRQIFDPKYAEKLYE